VIARNSSFVYRGQAVDVKQVSRSLGVRYVLEGSVRKSGSRIRITAQLVDALSGVHHWAERYDRDVTDIFALQDEIVQQVVGAIEPRLLAAEGLRSQSRSSEDLDAWDRVARAMSRYWRVADGDIEAAITMLQDTVRRHPDYAPGHSMLAFGIVLAGHLWRTTFEVPKIAIDSARRAAELDDRDPWAHLALGYVAFVRRQTEESVAQFRRAIELNPNFAAGHGYLGYPLAFAGQSDEAIASMLLAIRLSPYDRQNPIFMGGISVAHYCAKRYDLAIEWGRKGIQEGPSIPGLVLLRITAHIC
jgi:adenylate cyclase